jgi:hypothetical protein
VRKGMKYLLVDFAFWIVARVSLLVGYGLL